MLRKSGLPVQLQQLPSAPGLPEIHQYLSLALEKRGRQLQISWGSVDKRVEFILDIISSPKSTDPQWRLSYSEPGRKREVIFDYSSCDVLLVHNLIASSCNEVLQIAIDGKLKTSDFQPEPLPSLRKSMTKSRPDFEPGKSLLVPDAGLPNPVPVRGDLAHVGAPTLLQSLVPAKVTGKLEVTSSQGTALVYMQSGVPMHATTVDAVGEDALIELMTWKDGQFVFEPGIRTDLQTVHQGIESLLAQGIQLSDRINYLKNAGFRRGSFLHQSNPGLKDLEFVQRVARGCPTDVGTLGKFYRSLTGQHTIEELTGKMQISRNQLVHMVYHLVFNEVVKISNEAKQAESAVEPRPIDAGAIQNVMTTLRRAETGMFIYPAFLYFLELEYFRSYRSGSPLSVIVFEMRLISQIGQDIVGQVLPKAALLDAVGRISKLKRHVDLLAHYDAFDYVLLLPNTKAGGAHIFANRIVKALTATPLAGGVDPSLLSLAFGSASIPEDFLDLGMLLGACDSAVNKARHTKQTVVMYRDMKAQLAQ
jgi:GGDEF domain-containing protein